MAALIKDATGGDAELIEGSRGEFSIWVGSACVAQKDREGFPDDQEALAAVQAALSKA